LLAGPSSLLVLLHDRLGLVDGYDVGQALADHRLGIAIVIADCQIRIDERNEAGHVLEEPVKRRYIDARGRRMFHGTPGAFHAWSMMLRRPACHFAACMSWTVRRTMRRVRVHRPGCLILSIRRADA